MNVLQTTGRVPPHNLEAEESVLGAMLLSESAVSTILEKVRADDFYKPAHRPIFDSIVGLFGRGEAIDTVTVAEELRRTGSLEEIGGKLYLAHLVSSVPAASNAGYYARIVEETSLLRRLIEATQDAAALAYDSGDDVENVVDEIEQLILGVAQRRLGDRFDHIRNLLHDHLEQVEALQLRGSAVTGLPTGFMDLDKLTSGFQPSNLIIVAGRPSFGKTSFALNIAQYAAAEHQKAVAIFSLEMSKMELVQRLVCAEALVDVHKLRTGNLSDTDWTRLGQAVGRLADAPIYIDDTEALTVLEIRAKARRLKQKAGLDLVVVDYLQLMSGPRRAENRQQEISEISRSLKILARELSVPVIAVSQLSRAVEQRHDKRPMLADLRECVTGDTLVLLADGKRVPIRDLVGTAPRVLAVADGRIVEAQSDKVWRVGVRPVFNVRLASGRSLRATADHRLFGAGGWVRVKDLQEGDRLAIARSLPEPAQCEEWPDLRVALLGQLIGDGSYLNNAPLRYTTSSEDNSRIVEEAATKEFGCKVKRYAGRRTWHQLLITGNGNRWHPAGVNAWLRELGIFGQRSHEKRIPEAAFRLSNRQVALLLSHLWATDGTITPAKRPPWRHSVSYSTNSPGLARDVMALLARLGIVARVYAGRKTGYRPSLMVNVCGCADQRQFLDQVGAFGPKIPGAKALAAALEGVATGNFDTLPRDVRQQLKDACRARGLTSAHIARLRGARQVGLDSKSAPTRRLVAEMAELLDDPALRSASSSHLYWDTVRSVDWVGEVDVFDLTVPGPGCWLADTILSHNSGAIEQDSDVVLFIYRDEVYNADSSDKGTAEGRLAKHRNGPVGKLRLTFLENYTKFANFSGNLGG